MSKKLKFYWIDAFTNKKMGGNPCAVVLDADELDGEDMQLIAKEMNLSETAFTVKSSRADFGARYFTPAEEIPLAGHPTISTVKALIEDGQINLSDKKEISLELKAGIITVAINQTDSVLITMSQRKPEFMAIHNKELVFELFSLKIDDILDESPIQTVSTGTPQLMVPLKNKAALKSAVLKVEKYKDYKEKSDFFSPHLFCIEGFSSEGQTCARHFGVPPDTLEDAFTGSATGGMSAYLWHHGLIESPKFIAEQGHWMGRPGKAFVEVVGPRNAIETVKVGGDAVVLIEGEIKI